MKTLKISLGILIVVVSVTLTTICTTTNPPHKNLFSAQPEAITTGETNYNPGDRLKKMKCRCPNGDTGNSLRCKSDGEGENCTEIQQGSNGCYTLTLKLLCQGVGIVYYEK